MLFETVFTTSTVVIMLSQTPARLMVSIYVPLVVTGCPEGKIKDCPWQIEGLRVIAITHLTDKVSLVTSMSQPVD